MPEEPTRMHWLISTIDTTVSGNDVERSMTHQIQQNARLVRFQVRNAAIEGTLYNVNPALIGCPGLRLQVELTSLDYGIVPPQILYQSYRRIPQWSTAVFDGLEGAGNNRIYSTWWSAGDNELGVNQQCSWGGEGKQEMALTLWYRLARPALGQNPAGFKLQLTFAALIDVGG